MFQNYLFNLLIEEYPMAEELHPMLQTKGLPKFRDYRSSLLAQVFQKKRHHHRSNLAAQHQMQEHHRLGLPTIGPVTAAHAV